MTWWKGTGTRAGTQGGRRTRRGAHVGRPRAAVRRVRQHHHRLGGRRRAGARTARSHRGGAAAQGSRVGRACGPRGYGTIGPVGGVGVSDVPQEGGGRRVGGLDAKPGRPGLLAGIDRQVVVAAQPRPFPRGGVGPRPRRGHQGPARGRRGQAGAERVQRRRAGDHRPGLGARRIRRPASQDGQEPVPAQRGVRGVDREGRRPGPRRAGLLGAGADPGRRAGLRHRDHPGHHLRDPDRAG